MLRSAILRTLAQVEPSHLRINPHTIGVIGNQVCLTAKTGNPETVVRVCGEERDEGRSRMRRVTSWYMEFVRGHPLQTWRAAVTPELMTDSNHLNRVARLGSLLDAGDHSRGGQE